MLYNHSVFFYSHPCFTITHDLQSPMFCNHTMSYTPVPPHRVAITQCLTITHISQSHKSDNHPCFTVIRLLLSPMFYTHVLESLMFYTHVLESPMFYNRSRLRITHVLQSHKSDSHHTIRHIHCDCYIIHNNYCL